MVSVIFFTCYIELGFLLLGLLFCFVEVLGFFVCFMEDSCSGKLMLERVAA